MNSELIYAKQRMQDYFYAVYTLGTHYPPPGTNAAHGWFQQGMKELRKLGDYKDGSFEEGGDAQKLFLVFRNFVYTNCDAFSTDLYCGSVVDSVKINRDSILNAIKIISDLFALLGGDDKNNEQIKKQLAQDIGSFVDGIQGKTVSSGCHGNGWVSVEVKHAVAISNSYKDQILINLVDSDALIIKGLFTDLVNALDTLDTANHKPWLTGAWQIEYVAYHLVFAKALEQIGKLEDNLRFAKLNSLKPI